MRNLILAALAICAASRPAYALTGGPSAGAVSPNTLKLPDKPASVAGLSDAATIGVFSGQVSYSVPLDLPAGPAGFGPSLSLSYSGDLGNGPFGIGWGLGSIEIRRSLRDGVPTYTPADEFELVGVGGGGRLVPGGADTFTVEGQRNATLVRRIGNRWEVTDSNGTRYFLGLTDQSILFADSKQAAWHVEEIRDVTGLQRIKFEYERHQGQLYLRRIKWGPSDTFSVDVSLTARPDVTTSWRRGFAVTSAQRVSELRVFSFGKLLRSFSLNYEDLGTSTAPGRLALSRLISVTMRGRTDTPDGQLSLPTLGLQYVKAEPASIKELPNLDGWRLNERGVSLFDVDGDGMDDLLRLELGNHTWRKNIGGVFEAPRPLPGVGDVDLEQVRFMDLDGDARPELVRIVDDTWRSYSLKGSGNSWAWERNGPWPGTQGVPLHGVDVQFADVNGDGAIDVLKSGAGTVRLWLNSNRGLLPVRRLPAISPGDADVEIGNPNLRFEDINGDGLADAMYMTDEFVKMWLGRGDGTFVGFNRVRYPWDRVALNPEDVLVADMDRDGLLDIIRLTAGHAVWFPGLPDGNFDKSQGRFVPRPLGAAFDSVVTVSDANGNGSRELVWSAPNGFWIIDFAGTGTAGMLEQINNGLGKTTKFTYLSSATLSVQDERAGHPWSIKLPASIPVPVAVEINVGDGSPVRRVTYGVRNGFWDGEERRFGGFLVGLKVVPDAMPSGVRIEETRFHQGLGNDRVLRGMATFSETRSGAGTVYSQQESIYAALPATAPALLRKAALLTSMSRSFEGRPAAVETRSDFEYDEDIRVHKEFHLGRLDLDTDQKLLVHTYVQDDNTTGVRDKTCQDQLFALSPSKVPGALVSHTQSVYGEGATSLPLCEVGRGWVREVKAFVDKPTPRWELQSSTDFDVLGNPVRVYSGGVTRTLTYDNNRLRPEGESVQPAPGQTLSWSMQWDDVSGLPKNLTDPNSQTSFVKYDSLGRVVAVGQGTGHAHIRFRYDWQPRTASMPGPNTTTLTWDGTLASVPETTNDADHWRESVSVSNGAGEELFQAARLARTSSAHDWIISGWKERDTRGRVALLADPFYAPAIPFVRNPLAPVQQIAYDALDRTAKQTLPNGGEKSFIYKAFETTINASQQAPVTTSTDGLGRILHTLRTVNGTAEQVTAQYDGGDRITKMILQGGLVEHSFEYDSLGRLVRAHDPDIGERTMTYDERGWLRTHTNGAQQSVGFDYDDAGRLTKRYEVLSQQQSLVRPPVSYSFFYDLLPASSNNPETARLAKCQSGAGNLKSRLSWVLEPQGLTCFGYDEMGRQNLRQRVLYTAKGDRAGTSVDSVGTSTFAATGALLSEIFDDGFKAYPEYDHLGRLLAVKGENETPFWSVQNKDGVLGLDASGRVLSEKYGNGVEQTYARDSLGMPNDIKIVRPSINAGSPNETIFHTSVLRNLYGAPTSITDLDGHGLDHTATYGYDLGARLTNATVGQAANQYSFRYAYDGLQNMIKRAASGPRTDLSVMVGYYRHDDPAHPRQLTRVDSPLSTLCGQQSPLSTFGYDGAGRMVQQAGKTLQFDGFDQLLKVDEPSIPSLEYAYGFEGFRTWRKGPGQEEYWFSAGDVLRGVTREHVITVGERLVARVKASGVGGGVFGPLKWNWSDERKVGRTPLPAFVMLVLMAGMCGALAVMSAVQARRRRRWAPIGATGMVVVLFAAIVSGSCGSSLSRTGQAWVTPNVTYIHHGVAAGPVLFTRDDGSVLDERRYEPFGGDIDSFRETSTADLRMGSGVDGITFSIDPQNLLNKETDQSTGWSYHGARWMAASFAIWLSPDPPLKAPEGKFMAEPWSLNPYQYVEQNPTIYWDPDGREIEGSQVAFVRISSHGYSVGLEVSIDFDVGNRDVAAVGGFKGDVRYTVGRGQLPSGAYGSADMTAGVRLSSASLSFRSLSTFWPSSHSALDNRQGGGTFKYKSFLLSVINDTSITGGGDTDHGETMRGEIGLGGATFTGRLFTGKPDRSGPSGYYRRPDGTKVYDPAKMSFPKLYMSEFSLTYGVKSCTDAGFCAAAKLSLGVDSPPLASYGQQSIHKSLPDRQGKPQTPFFELDSNAGSTPFGAIEIRAGTSGSSK